MTMVHPRQSSSMNNARMLLITALISIVIIAQNGWTVHAGGRAAVARGIRANANGGAGRSNNNNISAASQSQSSSSSSLRRRNKKRNLQDDATTTTAATTDPAAAEFDDNALPTDPAAVDPLEDVDESGTTTTPATTTTAANMEEFLTESYETISEAVEEKLDSEDPNITPEDEENLVEAMEELNELAEETAELVANEEEQEEILGVLDENDPEEIVFGEGDEDGDGGEPEEVEPEDEVEPEEFSEVPEVPEPESEETTTTSTTLAVAAMEEGDAEGGEDVIDETNPDETGFDDQLDETTEAPPPDEDGPVGDETTDPNVVENDPDADTTTTEAPPAWEDTSAQESEIIVDPSEEATTTEAPPVAGEGEYGIDEQEQSEYGIDEQQEEQPEEPVATTTATPPLDLDGPGDDEQEELGPPLIYEEGSTTPTPDANKVGEWGGEGSGAWGAGATEKTTTAPTPAYGDEETSVPTPADDDGNGDWDWGSFEKYPTKAPTDRPTFEYVPIDNDPLDFEEEPDLEAFEEDNVLYHGLGGTVGSYLDGVESPKEMETDKNIQVVGGILVGLFMVLMLITAHLVMHYPDGLCAGCCRLTLKCICCFTRTLCLPCRAICCKGSDQSQGRRTHAPMRTPFPSDLELA